MDIQERVKGIIVEQLGVGEDEVSPTASFVDDLGADSLDQVELVMAFEEEFKLEIGDEDIVRRANCSAGRTMSQVPNSCCARFTGERWEPCAAAAVAPSNPLPRPSPGRTCRRPIPMKGSTGTCSSLI